MVPVVSVLGGTLGQLGHHARNLTDLLFDPSDQLRICSIEGLVSLPETWTIKEEKADYFG